MSSQSNIVENIARRLQLGALLVAMVLAGPVLAKIPEPDHILYGAVTQFGAPVADGTIVTIILAGQSEPVTTYTLGDDPDLNGLFALRVPMDSVDPRAENTARPGENATVYVAGQLAAETTIGEQGTAVRLDLDPANLTGFPNLSVGDIDLSEGSAAAISNAQIPVSLSTTTSETVVVNWATADGSATAGNCPGGDYLASSGSITIPPGSLGGTIVVDVCGDDEVESTESFQVNITSADFANIADGVALVSIFDDDSLPSLSIADVVVIEPPSGSTQAQFTVTLSQVSGSNVSVTYSTAAGTATDGLDFIERSGVLSIPAGNPTGTIVVTVLADSEVEPDESFSVSLSLPTNASLAQGTAVATIIDPVFDPSLSPVDLAQQGVDGVDGMTGAAAVVLSPDGEDVYVAGPIDDAVAQFDRNITDGSVTFNTRYDQASSGFAGAILDAAVDVATNPDGSLLFVAASAAAPADGAISILSRNSTTGALSFLGVTADTVPNMAGVRGLAVSPDGSHLYAAARDDGAITAFSVGGATTLAFVQSSLGDGLTGASDIAISSDGNSVYVTAAIDNLVALFERNSDSSSLGYGQLTFVANYKDNVGGVSGLGGATGIVISPDQQHVYVTGRTNDTLAIFDRATDGSLSYRETLTGGGGNLFAMRGPTSMAISKDGLALAVIGFADNSVTLFERQSSPERATHGALAVTDVLRDESGGITLLAGPTDLKFSGDDRYLYVTTSVDNALLVFERVQTDVLFSSGFESPP